MSADQPHHAPRVLGGPRVEEERGQPASNMTGVRDTLEVTGRTVARLGFGAMRLAGPRIWGPPTDRAQVALAWLLARSPVMCPIPGTSSLAHLDQNIAAATLRLTDQQVTTLTAAANRHTPTAGYE